MRALPFAGYSEWLPAGFAVLRQAGRRALDTLLPPRCLACGSGVGEGGAVCAPCWAGIGWLGAPCCAACGLPFEWDQGRDAVCG